MIMFHFSVLLYRKPSGDREQTHPTFTVCESHRTADACKALRAPLRFIPELAKLFPVTAHIPAPSYRRAELSLCEKTSLLAKHHRQPKPLLIPAQSNQGNTAQLCECGTKSDSDQVRQTGNACEVSADSHFSDVMGCLRPGNSRHASCRRPKFSNAISCCWLECLQRATLQRLTCHHVPG